MKAALNMVSGFYFLAHINLDPDFQRFGSEGAEWVLLPIFLFYTHPTSTTLNHRIAAAIASTIDIILPLSLVWQLHKVTPIEISKKR